MKNRLDLGIVQITTDSPKRIDLLKGVSAINQRLNGGNYTLVGPDRKEFKDIVDVCEDRGINYCIYTGWEVDQGRKWRQGMYTRKEEWIAFLADDIQLDEEWHVNMAGFLRDREPGQYGFRLTDENGNRHEFGEDWMQFPNRRLQLNHRPLNYDVETGWTEESPTSYVANCVVHRDVLAMVEPFGLYRAAPDVGWSFANRQCGFPVGFNPKARAYHLGPRGDYR